MRGVRKLAAVSIGFSAAIFIAHYLLKLNMLLPAAGVCAVAGVSGFVFKGNARKRIMLFFMAAALGLLSYKYFAEAYLSPCEELSDSTMTLRAEVTAYPEMRDGYNMLYVRFCDDKLPETDGVLFDYSESTDDLIPGDIISAEVKLRSARYRYGEKTDINVSKGLYALGYLGDECTVVGHSERDFIYFPKHIGHAIGEKIREIFPDDTYHFMLALLTGDRSDYYGDGKLSVAMSTAGLAHVVAVSGMHVAFLVGFLLTVLGRNRRSALLCIAFVWVFVVMVGAPPSSVRAAIMQTMLLSAYLFRREFDNITVLSFALGLILLFNPFACGSISLQLSFGAMAGIMFFTQPVYMWLEELWPKAKGRPGKLRVYVEGALASSVSATVFTVPLIAVHFGYVSVLSPLANILCLWCISLLFCGGYIACALGFVFSALGKAAAFILSYFVRYIDFVVCKISEIPFSAVYTENKLTVLWLILSYLAFAVFLLLRRRKKLSALIPVGITVLGFAALVLALRLSAVNDPGTITVMDVGNGQCICITCGDNVVAIDCGSSGVSENAGFTLQSYVHAGGRNRVDALVLTHLHKDHANGVCRLLNSIDVGAVILPQNAEDENGILDKILAAAEENGVEIVYVDSDCTCTVGDINVTLYALDKNEGALMLTAEVRDYKMLVTGDAETDAEIELTQREELGDTDLLMVGHHGSKYACCEELLAETDPEIAVISVGENRYGHPTEETLARLSQTDAEIYRTDINGRFVLRLE